MKKSLLVILVLLFSLSAFGQETMEVRVFFWNEIKDPNLENCSAVYPVVRKIPKTKGVARAALLELFKGPTKDEKKKGFYSMAPRETKEILKNIKVKDGAAFLNFKKVVYQQMGTVTTSCGSGYFASIEKTLKQFPTITKVFYAIEGNPRDFYEWVQVGECPAELKNCSGENF